jgi:hypothetical protein
MNTLCSARLTIEALKGTHFFLLARDFDTRHVLVCKSLVESLLRLMIVIQVIFFIRI